MTNLTLGEITQSLLALIVVVGGGVLLAIEPGTREPLMGMIGLVLGFYFNRANGILRERNHNGNGGAPK